MVSCSSAHKHCSFRVGIQRLGVAGEQAGWLLYRAASYLRERGLSRQARPIAEGALAVTEAAIGPDDPTVVTWRHSLGVVLHDLGDLAGAKQQYERALAIGEAALGPDHPHRSRLPPRPGCGGRGA
jgi:hypothetical protein